MYHEKQKNMEFKCISSEDYKNLLGLIESMKKSIDELSNKNKTDFDFLNSQEVCQMLCISKRCLANYTSSGILKSSKLNGLNYYKKSQIIELLEKNYK
jgi:hypothetical protein